MIVNELKVRRGEPVRTAWARLARWVESLRLVPSDEIEVRLTKHGTIVKVRDANYFKHPFRVWVAEGHSRVAKGTVNGEVPVIKETSGELRRIDNRDKEGIREVGKSEPQLKLDIKKAGKDGRIFIALKVSPPPKKKIDPVILPEIIQIEDADGPLDGFGYYPLAEIILDKERKAIEETFQIVHHNIKFSFQERNPTEEELKTNPGAKPVGRYIFHPV